MLSWRENILYTFLSIEFNNDVIFSCGLSLQAFDLVADV